MWSDIGKLLATSPDAVLTARDSAGYPLSIRCRPQADASAQVLRLTLSPDLEIRPGPASLLWHSHDEKLWNLRATLLRGEIRSDGDRWIFSPRKLVGQGSGLQAALNLMVGCRRTAGRYLQSRGIARPKVPWDQINAVK